MSTKSKAWYRKKIRRKLFWRRHGTVIITWGLVAAAVLALLGALLWREYADQKEAEAAVALEAQRIPAGDGFSVSPCLLDPSLVPEYSGEPYVNLTEGVPGFHLYDLTNFTGEAYKPLDELGRCQGAMALLHKSLMPKEERGPIGQIKPSGWNQKKYAGIIEADPPYLYHRCHLIAYAMTGQNANERNLITGSSYLNLESMLEWETKVLKYLDRCGNHVLYRVTPVFRGEELVCRGVEMEAYSLEDHGAGLCFHVFVFNVQPGIEIDYATGESHPSP